MTKKIQRSVAIVCLLLNILVLPGLGSVIGGKYEAGVMQLVFFIIGIPLSFICMGIPMMIGAWIWAIFTGVQLLEESDK